MNSRKQQSLSSYVSSEVRRLKIEAEKVLQPDSQLRQTGKTIFVAAYRLFHQEVLRNPLRFVQSPNKKVKLKNARTYYPGIPK